MTTHTTTLLIIIGALLVAGTILLKGPRSDTSSAAAGAVLEDGTQYIDITARGGYTPRRTSAVAGIPTVIRMHTENTYDCSLALVIPDIGYQAFLPQTGNTEIDVPIEYTRGTLRGMCSMAMYHFEITFE